MLIETEACEEGNDHLEPGRLLSLEEERAALVGELIQSLETEVDPDAEAAWALEIRARLERLDSAAAVTVPWSEARRRIHAVAVRAPSSTTRRRRPPRPCGLTPPIRPSPGTSGRRV